MDALMTIWAFVKSFFVEQSPDDETSGESDASGVINYLRTPDVSKTDFSLASQGTANFRFSEFDCKDGASTPPEYRANLTQLCIEILEPVRAAVGCPIQIVSGYRSPEHNKAVDGAKFSYHLKALAADARPIGPKAPKIEDFYNLVSGMMDAGAIPQGGCIIYDSWLHVDLRGFRFRKDSRKSGGPAVRL